MFTNQQALDFLSGYCQKLTPKAKKEVHHLFRKSRDHHLEEIVTQDMIHKMLGILLPLPAANSTELFTPWKQNRIRLEKGLCILHDLPVDVQTAFVQKNLMPASALKMIFIRHKQNG